MPFLYPKDTEELQKERESFRSLFNKLDVTVWAANGPDRTDHGMDYGFEFIENGEYKGYRIYSQVKATRHINKKEDAVIFDLKVQTASYAISSAQPFVLFVADLEDDIVYYQCLQDYFIDSDEALEALGKNKSTIRIKIPSTNTVTRKSVGLQAVAKCQYCMVNGKPARVR